MLSRYLPPAVLLMFLALVAQRIWRYATFVPNKDGMPAAISQNEERLLFQSPGGKYTKSDIAMNGERLPSEAFRGFRSQHDLQPRPGDQICPVTRTKANSECTWMIGGETYAFCCPPCIAEFVRQSKERPETIFPAKTYVATTE